MLSLDNPNPMDQCKADPDMPHRSQPYIFKIMCKLSPCYNITLSKRSVIIPTSINDLAAFNRSPGFNVRQVNWPFGTDGTNCATGPL
jgi:hypothetical protein